jgi:competence protein ComEA
MKRIWKEYFSFSKKERIAVIILLALIACFIVIPYVYTVRRQPPLVNKTLLALVAKMDTSSRDGIAGNAGEEVPPINTFPKKTSLFSFDPNTIGEEGWSRLGLQPRTIRTIMNYRNKGGRFRSPADIRKIWGLSKDAADKLIGFVQIAGSGKVTDYQLPVTGNRQPATTTKIIDINMATIDDWKTLPGIGQKLAERLVNYRERIGGFSDALQVKKTYGISDSVFTLIAPWLKTDAATMPRLDLNRVSAYELRQRANIPDAVARAIIVYRQQYGPFLSVDDLKKIVFMKDSLFQRIVSFVRVE